MGSREKGEGEGEEQETQTLGHTGPTPPAMNAKQLTPVLIPLDFIAPRGHHSNSAPKSTTR